MPKMDGITLLEKVSSSAHHPKMRMILSTGGIREDFEARLRALGPQVVDQILPKPCGDDELVALVKRVLSATA